MGELLTWDEKTDKIQALNLTSDVFAGKVLEEPEVLEEFLNLLTGRRWRICEVKKRRLRNAPLLRIALRFLLRINQIF